MNLLLEVGANKEIKDDVRFKFDFLSNKYMHSGYHIDTYV